MHDSQKRSGNLRPKDKARLFSHEEDEEDWEDSVDFKALLGT